MLVFSLVLLCVVIAMVNVSASDSVNDVVSVSDGVVDVVNNIGSVVVVNVIGVMCDG